MVGKTVTLELKPEQAETLARARQSGTLSLALRSIADVNAPETRTDDGAKRGDSINVVRYGVPARRRHRSDQRTQRYEAQGKSADRCGP